MGDEARSPERVEICLREDIDDRARAHPGDINQVEAIFAGDGLEPISEANIDALLEVGLGDVFARERERSRPKVRRDGEGRVV